VTHDDDDDDDDDDAPHSSSHCFQAPVPGRGSRFS
jgi:hypothetical protein